MKFFESLVPHTHSYIWNKRYRYPLPPSGLEDRYWAMARRGDAHAAEEERKRCEGHLWRFLVALTVVIGVTLVTTAAFAVGYVLAYILWSPLVTGLPPWVRWTALAALLLYLLVHLWHNTD